MSVKYETYLFDDALFLKDTDPEIILFDNKSLEILTNKYKNKKFTINPEYLKLQVKEKR